MCEIRSNFKVKMPELRHWPRSNVLTLNIYITPFSRVSTVELDQENDFWENMNMKGLENVLSDNFTLNKNEILFILDMKQFFSRIF